MMLRERVPLNLLPFALIHVAALMPITANGDEKSPFDGPMLKCRILESRLVAEYVPDDSFTSSTIRPPRGTSFLRVDLEISNPAANWGQLSLRNLALVDKRGRRLRSTKYKLVAAHKTACPVGRSMMVETLHRNKKGVELVRTKGRFGRNESFHWQLAPMNTYRDTVVFLLRGGGNGVRVVTGKNN